MGLFKKKESVEFNTTKVIFPGSIEYDEEQKLIRVKNGLKKEYISSNDVDDIIITCGNKTVSKKNLGGALLGYTVFGPAGLLLAGSHDVEYISNLTITIIGKDGKRVFYPLVIGKVKKGNWLETAEKIVSKLEEIIE